MKYLLLTCSVFWVVFCCPMLSLRAQTTPKDSLQRLLNAHPQHDDRRAELLNALAFLVHASTPEKALSYADEVIGFADEIQDKKFVAGAYTQKSIAHTVMSNLDSAQYWAEQSLELETRTGHKEGVAASISNLGLIEYRLNNYPAALAKFQEAAQLFRETNHPNELNLYLNMASIYAEMKNFNKAKEYFEKALYEGKRLDKKNVVAYAVLNLGTMYTEQGDYETGRRYLDSALVANQQVNDQANIAKVYGNLGASYSRTGDHRTSNAFYQQALAINTRLKNERSIAVNASGMGENYLLLDSLPLAYHNLSQGLALAKSQGAIDVQRDAAQHLSTFFEKKGQLDSALFYHRQFVALKDSLDNEANRKALTRMELQYDFDLKEQELLQQQAISKLQIRQLWLYGALLVIALVALGGYLLNRSRIRGIHLRNALREQELTQQAEALLLKQQLSESELKAIRAQMNPHFIFNVLNSIESYILENDAKSASRLVQQFARLTRLVLENSTQALVSADREWACVKLYTELEATRFEHSFDYAFQVAEGINLADIVLPPMLIQPLIENAIHHGLRHVEGYRGKLSVSIAMENDETLVVSVSDNGIGLTATKSRNTRLSYKEKSLGIAGIRERLALLNNDHPNSRTGLSFEPKDGDENKAGTTVRLVLAVIRTDELVSDLTCSAK